MAAKKKATAKKKAASKKTTSKKATAKKSTAKKSTAKKTASKKPAAKKAAPKKAAAKKSTTKKPATKKAAAKKPARSKKGLAAAGSAAESLGFTPYQQKKSEEYMSEPMKQHFREILAAWKRELMEEVDRTVHHMQDEAANFPDPSDRATQESEFSLELRTRDRERKLIRKIDSTFKLIDADEYGWCDTCGIEIGIRRLEARPTASQCIDCKTLDEIREKQMMN
ncbi:MAG: RNA polymerase-binding protein DksA [Gammaproteobacteria bacterium]|nr:RNA polymerase-binding protein DksA [Gammaproteobacteria bacterium]